MTETFQTLNEMLTSPQVLVFPDFDARFIVETNALSFAVGVILARKKEDGKIHPVNFARRAMISAKINYSACESEPLAVLFFSQEVPGELVIENPFQNSG